MKIAARLLSFLIDFAAYRKVDGAQLRACLNTPDMDLCKEGEFVSMEEYLAVQNVLQDSIEDPNWGLSFGCFLNLNAMGLIYQISLATRSIQQALRLLDEFLAAQFPLVKVTRSEEGDQLRLHLECSVEDPVLKKRILSSTFVFMYRELCLMMRTECVEGILPQEEVMVFQLRLKQVMSAGKGYGFTFSKSELKGEINPRKLKTIEVLLPQFMQWIEAGKGGDRTFSGEVRSMVLSLCQPEFPTLDQVSSVFAMSNRTFQRKLTGEGTSFRRILTQIKKELADYLVQDEHLKVQDIAYILGYSEPAAFLHARGNW